MSPSGRAFRFGATFAALGTVLSTTAQAASSEFTAVDPLVSLSVFGTSASRAAVCAAGAQAATGTAAAASAAAAVQAPPGPGCVLPVLDATPAPVVGAPVVPVTPAPSGFNLGAFLPLIGVGALGILAMLLLDDDDELGEPISPF